MFSKAFLISQSIEIYSSNWRYEGKGAATTESPERIDSATLLTDFTCLFCSCELGTITMLFLSKASCIDSKDHEVNVVSYGRSFTYFLTSSLSRQTTSSGYGNSMKLIVIKFVCVPNHMTLGSDMSLIGFSGNSHGSEIISE